MFTKCSPAIAILLLLTGCGTTSPRPVDIEAADMCAYCKMAISEKRYAAEAVDGEGSAYKFDNAACMARFVKEHGLQSRIAAYYIADYRTRAWLDARRAIYAKSPEIPSPMASGLAAFSDEAEAQRFAAARRGQTIAFEALWTPAQ